MLQGLGMTLTVRQQAFLNYITAYQKQIGCSPTQREMKEFLGYKSLGSVQDFIKRLTVKGYIEKRNNTVRGIKLIGACPVCGSR